MAQRLRKLILPNQGKSMPPADKPTAPDDATLDAYIDAAPALVALTIDPAYREGVRTHLRATANAARLVLEFPLDDEAEPAPIFRA
jgi:1-carboxybiuret hydrolase subunit AtzG-like protein